MCSMWVKAAFINQLQTTTSAVIYKDAAHEEKRNIFLEKN